MIEKPNTTMIEKDNKNESNSDRADIILEKESLYDLAQQQIALENQSASSTPEDTVLSLDEQQQYDILLAQADPELAESVKNETKKNGFRKLVLGVGLVSSQVAVGMNAETPKVFETLDSNPITKEIPYEISEKNTDDIANPFNIEIDPDINPSEKVESDKDKENVTTDKESETSNMEKFEVDLTASFELGNAVMTIEKQQEIQLKLTEFFDNLPQEIKDNINSGKTVINIESGSSPELIVKAGIDSGRGIVHNNEELSIHRAEAAAEPTEAALRAVHMNADIEFKVPKGGVNLESPVRYVKVSIVESLSAGISKAEARSLPEGLADFENVMYEIIDESPSMRAESADVKAKVKQVVAEFGLDIAIKELNTGESGGSEKHLETLNELLEEIESKSLEPFATMKKIRIRTDEPDFDSSKALRKGEIGKKASEDYSIQMQKVLDSFKKLNIQVELIAYEPGDTLNSITKILDADDLIRTEFDSEDQGWYANLKK